MRLIVATNNAGKIAELRELLPEAVELLSLHDVGLASPVETGTTFLENARLKALAAVLAADGALADDSGLEVAALHGAPGVRSARFAGPDATDADNNHALLAVLSDTPVAECGAQFVSCVVLALPDGREWHAEGTVQGRILRDPRGISGFGYDPLFEIDDPDEEAFNGRTMAELTRAEKNETSHRARAYRRLVAQLQGSDFWPA